MNGSTYTATIPVKIINQESLIIYMAERGDMGPRDVASLEEVNMIANYPIDPQFPENCLSNIVARIPWEVANLDIIQARDWMYNTLANEFQKRKDD